MGSAMNESKASGHSTCPLCHGPTSQKFARRGSGQLTADSFSSRKTVENHHPDYRECALCQVLVAVEQIDPLQLNELYRSATFTSADESRFAARTYSRVLEREIKNASSILDIGSSDGAFLTQCRKLGVNALLGIEPSAAAAAVATENTWVGPFAQYSGEGEWDLITLFMTIEHLQDPEDFLQWAKKRLAPGGLLAVAHHDYRAPVNLVLGARSPILDIEHLRIYSKTSMKKTFEDSRIRSHKTGDVRKCLSVGLLWPPHV